jgi:uncharacterized protein YcbK (DUF882 family)
MTTWHFFKDSEVNGLDQEFVALLDRARGMAGVPFIITSGLRSPDQNKNIGGVEDSAHLFGLAVDLLCRDDLSRFKIVKALISLGVSRIGIYSDGHIHCDVSTTLPQGVMWNK